MNRRTLLTVLAAAPLRGQQSGSRLTILPEEELGTISPRIYGHFTEHIGRLIYEGIWVGSDSKIPNTAGFRLDVLNALKRVRPTVIRWPGGCFADAYHWQDGVGPQAQRPVRNNHWWLRTETNAFGTDEFLRWCEMLSTEPYLSLNLGSGSLDEALNWIEYCNGPGESKYTAMRTRNGRAKPYGVKWWGIGNENWGCGGMFSPSEYAQLFRQYAVYIKRLGMSSDSELVGVGHTADNWNRRFLEAAGAALPYLDHLSVHRYFRRGHSTKFTDAEYASLMGDLTAFDSLIRDCLAAIDEVEPRRAKIPVFGKMPRKPMGLILDEWGVWHDDAHIDDGFSQNGTLRDAIFAASCLNLFHRYAARITMTNIAQVINCLQSLILTAGDRMTLTPTFHVYEMYRAHQGAKSLRVDLTDAPMLSASASRSGNSFLITVVNQDPNQESEVRIDLRGAKVQEVRATNLTGSSVRAANTTDQPDVVTPRPWKVEITGGELRTRVPARSVQAITAT